MDNQARRFRQAAVKCHRGRSGKGIRYPQQLHDEAVSYANSRRQRGDSLLSIARDLRLKPVTIKRWIEEARRPGFRRVEFIAGRPDTAGPETKAATVTLPNGIRIDGLSFDLLIDLLKHLG